jgi:hypothetical protein
MRNLKFPVSAVVAFGLLAWGVSCQSLAAEPMLFQASSFLSSASEANVLTEREKLMVGMRRADRFTKVVSIAEINTSVLQSPAISIEMPDHTVYRFSGVVKELSAQGSPGYFSWTGIPLGATAPTLTPEDTALGRHIVAFYPTSLDLFFDRNGKSVSGHLRTKANRFHLQPLNAKYMMMLEEGLNPASPPIDAEPPGSRQSRPPRTGRDWAPGLLTERLRSSIASSSIGASLSPESCDQVTSCGSVTRFSCHPEVDGPEMFFDNTTGVLIMACGGSCMRGAGLPGSKLCTACPPPEWKSCGESAKPKQK